MYRMIYYPVDLPTIQDLEMTDCRYPVIFQPNRGRPKKEVRLTKPNPSIQKCSRCKIQGIHSIIYCFKGNIIQGHNKASCPLPSDDMVIASTAEKKKKTKKVPTDTFSPNMCSMLKQFAIDHLDHYSRKYHLSISHYASEEHIGPVLDLIGRVLADQNLKEDIAVAITFYLLFLRSLSDVLKSKTQELFNNIASKNGISADAEWVCQ